MARYYRYHAGNGYGLVRNAASLPLATGTAVHECLAEILRIVKGGSVPRKEAIRGIIQRQTGLYQKQVAEGGFLNVEDQSEVEYIVKEQCALVEGMIWGWNKVVLPVILDQFKIIDIEREETLVVGCDCGEPSSDAQIHSNRDCHGIVQMSRPDIVLEDRVSGEVGVHDFKTTSSPVSNTYVEEFRESVQMAVGTVAVERRLGRPVRQYYIHALVKGQRRNEYESSSRTYSGPRRQQSILCYGYQKEANPPVWEEDWQPQWKYRDNSGRGHTLGKGYSKRAIWEDFKGGVESWCDSLPLADLAELFVLIGPYQRQDRLVDLYFKEMLQEEQKWINTLWQETEVAGGLPASGLIPRSWDCMHYGSRCEFYDLCFGRIPLDKALDHGYILRRPHHQPEIDQMVGRGIEVPAGVVEE